MPITSIKWDTKNFAINSQVKDFVVVVRNHKLKRLKTNKRKKKKKLHFKFFKKRKKGRRMGEKKPKHDDFASSTKLMKTS